MLSNNAASSACASLRLLAQQPVSIAGPARGAVGSSDSRRAAIARQQPQGPISSGLTATT